MLREIEASQTWQQLLDTPCDEESRDRIDEIFPFLLLQFYSVLTLNGVGIVYTMGKYSVGF